MKKMKFIKGKVTFEVDVMTLVEVDGNWLDDTLEDIAYKSLENSGDTDIDIDEEIEIEVPEEIAKKFKNRLINKEDIEEYL